jgi:signal transduction histidine kinase
LGLFVTYGVIRAHRGQITATSRPGKGTTFSILLPAAPPPEAGGSLQPPSG